VTSAPPTNFQTAVNLPHRRRTSDRRLTSTPPTNFQTTHELLFSDENHRFDAIHRTGEGAPTSELPSATKLAPSTKLPFATKLPPATESGLPTKSRPLATVVTVDKVDDGCKVKKADEVGRSG